MRFELDDGHVLTFCDPRRFGTGELALGYPDLEEFFDARLGVEPLSPDFTTEHLYLQTRKRRTPIKALLLDQRRVAGVGNIYANEALFRARIHPLRSAGLLKRAQVAALRDAVVASLEAGLGAGGASIDDFRHPDGVKGAFQNEFLVHSREGEPCTVCGTAGAQVRRRRARHVRLRVLPDAPARAALPRADRARPAAGRASVALVVRYEHFRASAEPKRAVGWSGAWRVVFAANTFAPA